MLFLGKGIKMSKPMSIHLNHPVYILEAALERCQGVINKCLAELTNEQDIRLYKNVYKHLDWWCESRDTLIEAIELCKGMESFEMQDWEKSTL